VYGCSVCDDDARLHLDVKHFDTLSSSEDISYLWPSLRSRLYMKIHDHMRTGFEEAELGNSMA
jgi:hypothetical protein